MKKMIISTCGTSLYTNNVSAERKNDYFCFANESDEKKIPESLKESILNVDEIILNKFNSGDINIIKAAGAECNSLISYYNSMVFSNMDIHFLVKTDTYLGNKTAEHVMNWIQNSGGSVGGYITSSGLNNSNISMFTAALVDLVKWFSENIPLYRNNGYKIIFNLTGGFKSLNGFLQNIAAVYADEVIYIFETGKEMLRIPSLPLKIDSIDIIEKNIKAFLRTSFGETIDIYDGLPTLAFDCIDEKCYLNWWGRLIWEEGKKNIMSGKMLEPFSNRLRISKDIENQINNLSPDRKYSINNNIMKLCHFLETGKSLDSMGFKKLTNPKGKLTHEFYAYSDQDAKRFYCSYEGDVLVVKELGDHL